MIIYAWRARMSKMVLLNLLHLITQFAIGSKRLFLHEEQNYVQICGYLLGRFDTICYICEVELTRGIGKLSLQGEQKLYADP